jgi:hypothetical protein
MRVLLFALVAAFLALSTPAGADVTGVVGTWRGESLCVVKPSACHDEVIVYRFARGKKPGTLVVTADKIVDGKALNMGALDCTADGAGDTIDCPVPNGKGTFRYQIQGSTLRGTLTLTDGTLFRRVTATKSD